MIKVNVQKQTPVSVGLGGADPMKVGMGTVVVAGKGGIDVSGASVGQIVKIAAVDENGKPTAWEAVDLPEQVQSDLYEGDETDPSYVKHQTHGKKRIELERTSSVFSDTTNSLTLRYLGAEAGILVCLEINGIKFDGLSLTTASSSIGDGADYLAVWESGGGYGFTGSFNSSMGLSIRLDESRFGPTKYADVRLYKYETTVLSPEYLPLPTTTSPGVVIAPIKDDLGDYDTCAIDAKGSIYSKKYLPAKVFSELSQTNLKSFASNGEHGLFTDSISDEISSVVDLVLPVHAWRIKAAQTIDYILESADGKKVLLQLGSGFSYVKASVLVEPSSGGSLIVSLRPDDFNYATHNSAEIYEAFQSGKTVQFCDGAYVCQLIFAIESFVAFSCTVVMEGAVIAYGFGIGGDGSIIPQCNDWINLYPMDSMLLNSSTEGSSKQFRITVDDSGTISAVEVT